VAVKLFKNFIFLISAEVYTKVITFIAFAYLARKFGASGFGYIEWAGAALMCTSLLVDQGFSAYGTREIAKEKKRATKLVNEIVTARFIFSISSYVILAIFAVTLTEDPVFRDLLLIYGLSLLVLPLLLQWVFQGFDKMHLVAIAQIIRQTVFVGIIFLLIQNSSDLYLVGVAEVAGVSSAALFSVIVYRLKFTKFINWRPQLSKELFREGIPIGLSQMFWVVKMFGATFIVGFVATSEDTGYFAGAMRIYIALHTFVWLYFANLLPSLSRSWVKTDGSYLKLIKNSLMIVVPLSIIGGIFWVLLSPYAMKIAYGAEFLKGSSALQWLAGACVAAAISGHFRFGLIAAGYQNKEMWTAALGTVFVIFAIPISYKQAGIAGVSASLFLAELIILFVVILVSQRTIFYKNLENLRAL
jgi:O-antigen/teichoic acid export membrane protein